jgi:hypothetical protein
MRILARSVAFLAVSVGILGLIAPDRLLALGTAMTTPTGLYAAAALRLFVGLALLIAASASRMPRTLRVIGVLAMIGGILTPLFGVDRSTAVVNWWTSQGPVLVRVPATVLALVGAFLMYATSPAGPSRRVA